MEAISKRLNLPGLPPTPPERSDFPRLKPGIFDVILNKLKRFESTSYLKDLKMAANRELSDPFKQVWIFFASVKLTVVLLLTLAVTSILGTLIPQNETPAAYVRAFGEVL